MGVCGRRTSLQGFCDFTGVFGVGGSPGGLFVRGGAALLPFEGQGSSASSFPGVRTAGSTGKKAAYRILSAQLVPRSPGAAAAPAGVSVRRTLQK